MMPTVLPRNLSIVYLHDLFGSHGWDRSVSRSFLIFLHLVTTVRIGENPIKLFPFSSTHNPC
ncbi:c-di-GMP-specific phosphodiesterase class I [Pseudomonas syringae pv. actinidiae]|uniref:C-di-GMP-specific phosphodiesterase class I n=1 Tax=Pseudomonas syringae pv. actinidiae TaxID=103796 RepID=A0A2V0QJV3_PSESF|nr:c-di-GMP-specific phosphodiesterase class I [Pseudomonas syringae pv. actinidiae]